MLATAPISIQARRVVTPLYPGGVVVNPAGTSIVTADPHGNKAGLAARAALVGNRRFKSGQREYSHFLIRAYNPRTGDVYLQQETGSAVHRVNRVTGACDCEDAVKGETKRLRMACVEAGLDPDDLPEAVLMQLAAEVGDAVDLCGMPPALHCKHFWIFGEILRGLYENCPQPEARLSQFPAELPRTYWALCPSKQTTKEYAR